jgi:hypothetical protein
MALRSLDDVNAYVARRAEALKGREEANALELEPVGERVTAACKTLVTELAREFLLRLQHYVMAHCDGWETLSTGLGFLPDGWSYDSVFALDVPRTIWGSAQYNAAKDMWATTVKHVKRLLLEKGLHADPLHWGQAFFLCVRKQ